MNGKPVSILKKLAISPLCEQDPHVKKGPHSFREKLERFVLRNPDAPKAIKEIVQKIRDERRREFEERLQKFHSDHGKFSDENFHRIMEAKKNVVVFGPYSDDPPVHY